MISSIAECHRVDEVKDIRDRAWRVAPPRKAGNSDAEMRAMEVRMRAERRAGELLKETAANGERSGKGNRKSNVARRLHFTNSHSPTSAFPRINLRVGKKLAEIPQPAHLQRV